MSGTIGQHIYEVRRLLNDSRKGSDPIVSTRVLEELTNIAIEALSEEMGLGQIETVSFVPIVAGTDTYTITLPAGIPNLGHLQALIGADLNWPLEVLTREMILERRAGSGTPATGHPVTGYHTYQEHVGGALKLIVDPIPSQNDTLTAIWNPVHARVVAEQVTAALEFSKKGLTALRLRVAAMVVEAVDARTLQRLGLNPNVAASWRAESDSVAMDEGFRLSQGNRVSGVIRCR